MMDVKLLENNQVSIAGQVMTDYEFDHEVQGEKFYRIVVQIPRLSDKHDDINVVVSEKMVDTSHNPTGAYVKVSGQFRSFNDRTGKKTKLRLFVFAKEIDQIEAMPLTEDCNTVRLSGTLCKAPIYRKTPLGKIITDLVIAVNRLYGRSDYIPCIAWYEEAEVLRTAVVGDKITVTGRIQSREYDKHIDDEKVEKRIAYEMSISNLEEFDSAQMAEEAVV